MKRSQKILKSTPLFFELAVINKSMIRLIAFQRHIGTCCVRRVYYACGHAIQVLGYHLLNDICWFKPNASPNLSCRFFTASHETLLWVRKNKKGKHVFNYDDMRDGDFPGDGLKVKGKQMRSVWSIPYTPQSEKLLGKHPTQKPVKLLERIILASSNPGDIVLDPFCGSGTTGVAAIKNGRKFVGIEREEEYVGLSERRMTDILKSRTAKAA